MSMEHQIIICPVANALVRAGYIYKYVNICHIAMLKHTLNTDLSPLTYTVHFIVVYTNITILTINSYYFVLDKDFSENESNRYNKYTFN